MTKPTKTVTNYTALNSSDQRLAAKLITTMSDAKLDASDRTAISRALIRSRRGPNASSPESKKKFSNGYTVFYSQRYAVVQKENKSMDITGIAKLLGVEWRGLTEKDRAVFKEQAKAARG
jgi:hypothetical protein